MRSIFFYEGEKFKFCIRYIREIIRYIREMFDEERGKVSGRAPLSPTPSENKARRF